MNTNKKLCLRDVADVVNGFAFPVHYQFDEGTIPFFKVSDMNSVGNDEFLTAANFKVSEDSARKLKIKIYPKGTIVFPKVGGALMTNKKRTLQIPGTFDNNVMGIVPREVSGQWLRYWFETVDLRTLANVQALPSIRKSDVEKLPVAPPSWEDQEAVSVGLRERFEHFRTAKKASSNQLGIVEALEFSLLHSGFHESTPISIGPSPEPAPDGWQWRPLSDLARLESGHTPSRRQPEWWGGDIPWLALPDIRELDGQIALSTKERTNELGIANSSARILPCDTVALSRTASVGFVTIFGREMATSQDFVNWICGDALVPRFLMHALRASREYLVGNASGAIHKTLYMPAVKEFHLCLPDKRTQQKIVDQLDEALAARLTLLTAAKAELAAIEALPSAILREVFTDAA